MEIRQTAAFFTPPPDVADSSVTVFNHSHAARQRSRLPMVRATCLPAQSRRRHTLMAASRLPA
jgi:hypothetical protein